MYVYIIIYIYIHIYYYYYYYYYHYYVCILYNMKAIVPENIAIYCRLKLLQTHKRPAPCIFLLVVLGNMLKRQSHCFPDRCSSLQSSPLFKQVEQNGSTKIALLLRRCLEERFQPQTNAVICPPSTYSKNKSSLKLPIWYWSETGGFFFFLFLSRSPAAQLIR